MATAPITFDPSTAIQLNRTDVAPTGSPAPNPARALQSAMSYGVQQDPDQYAHLLDLQKRLGIPPVVSSGNEQQVKQAADLNSVNYGQFATTNPRTATWASNPDNAAVAGVDEVHRLAGIEQNAAAMRTVMPSVQAYAPTLGDKLSDKLLGLGQWMMDGTVSKQQLRQNFWQNPIVRYGADAAGSMAGMAGNVGSFFGWHGDDPTKQNLLQRVEANLDMANASAGGSSPLDTAAKFVGPLFVGGAAGIALKAAGMAAGLSSAAATVLSGLGVGAGFTADQGGKTYTSVAGAGGNEYDSRFAANRVAAINAIPNSLFGATGLPFLERFPLMTSLGIGAATGASGQVAQNSVTGRPWSEGVLPAAAEGAAVQGGMHIGFGAFAPPEGSAPTPAPADSAIPEQFAAEVKDSQFLSNLAQASAETEASQLRQRAPDKFYEATQAHFEGDQSLRIPAEQFTDYVKSKGMDPAEVAKGLGSTNYPEAILSGGDVEVRPADFLSKLNLEHRNALLPDVIDPATGLTARQHQEGRAELEQWATGGGAAKLQTEMDAADAETAATPEYQQVKEQLRQRYADAGETPEVADTLATKDANAYSNLSRSAGLKPSELLAMYNPKMVTGEAPAGAGDAALNQSSEDGARGWFRTLPDGSYEIGKTKIGDLSTFVHEPAHAYLKIIGDLAEREDASETLKSDYAKILDYLGAENAESLTRDQHEAWARANEQYLREGKAPSPGLKGTFQRFAIWLGTVYKKASDLGVTLSDDIRGVFDRLYAAESGVDKAEAEAGPKLFANPEEAGWTDEEFKKYAEARGVGVEQARSEVLAKLNEAALRERTENWRSEEKNVRAARTAEVDQSPQYTAIRSLRRGTMDDGTPLTLDRDALVGQFGEERVKALQKQHPGMYRNEGGFDPETAAEMLGFDSAHGLMMSLEEVPRRSATIDEMTRGYMTAKHGDIRYDGTLEDQARLLYENDKRAESLHTELKALKKKLAAAQEQAGARQSAMRSIEVAPIAAYRELAQQTIEAKAVADIQPTRYLDASRKYSREAFDALRKGDAQGAAEAKHKELLNHFLFREATEARDYLNRFETYAKRMQNKGVQAKIGQAGSDYREQFNRLLFRFGLAGAPAEAPQRSLAAWADALYNDGKEAAIDPSMFDESREKPYRQATVAQVRVLHDALINIRHLASQELGMIVNGRKVEFNSAIEGMILRARDSIKARPRPVFEENRTAGQATSDFVSRGPALLKRTEFLMKQLDGGTSGPWHDYLWHLSADAQGKENQLNEEVTKQVGDALKNMPKEQRMKLLDKVAIDGITEPLTRRRMLAMAFNMGNDGNLDRLEKTFMANGWEPRAIEQIKSSLTREEWQFVQDGWDSLKPLGQAQSELEKRLTGLPPVMVRPTRLQVDLADGLKMDLDGGYYPIVMDPKYSTRGAQQDASMTAQNMMEAGYGRAVTSRGNMKERTGFGGPLLLDYEQVLTQHTAKVIKDISHREFMLTANKVLADQGIRNTLRETVGDANEKQMLPWLRTIINNSNGTAMQGLSDISRAMSGLRTNVVKAALGFKFSTLLLQLTHASSIFLHTSPSSYAQAMIDFIAHPKDMTERIKGLSPNEMASRGDNLDRDMRKVLQDGIGKKSVGDMWAKAGMMPVQLVDHLLSFPLWMSVYRDALAGSSHPEGDVLAETEAKYQAMQKADGAVRMGLGSNAPKDLAPIMRNHDLTKLLTTMGGFHNLKYNQMSDVMNELRNGSGSLGGRAAKASYGMLMAALIPAVMGAYISGRGPKDGENVGAWASKRALLFPLETMAILNIVVEGIENHGDMRYSPIASLAERTAKDAAHAASDSEDKDWTGMGLDTLQTAMEGFGVSGTDQAFKAARYARRAHQGKIEEPTVWGAVVGGQPKK